MPTDLSTPKWCCDICLTQFGTDRDAADRCESAGEPYVLPPGSMMLAYDESQRSTADPDRPWVGPGFRMRPFYPTGRYGTVASTYNTRSGHTVHYQLDHDPASYPTGRHPSGVQPNTVESSNLWPHQVGRLHLPTNHPVGARRWHGHSFMEDNAWVLDAFGLPRSGMAGTSSSIDNRRVKPLTPEVAAVLDALFVRPSSLWLPNDPALMRSAERNAWSQLGGYALMMTAPTDGPASPHHAAWWLRSTDLRRAADALNELWSMWLAGKPIHVPRPWLKAHGAAGLTASKLDKRKKALVAATGVEWPARTDATGYVRKLITETLEYTVPTINQFFHGSRVITVRGRKGGVGKSTVSAALARRLAGDGATVLLVDLDLTGPSQHVIHKLGPVKVDTEFARLVPDEVAYGGRLRVFSSGQVFPPGNDPGWDNTSVTHWLSFIGTSIALADVDFVVLDMPPGDSPVHAIVDSPAVTVHAEVNVTTGHPLSLADTERDLTGGGARNSNRRILVENLSRAGGMIAGGTGQWAEIYMHDNEAAAPRLAERTGTTWGGSMPWASNVATLASSSEMGRLVHDVLKTTTPA